MASLAPTMPKSKSKKAKAKKPAKSKKAPIPPGFRTVTPYLAINGAAAAIDWYKKAFGAKELARQAVPDGKLMHARIRIGDSIVMLSDTFPGGTQSPDVLGNSPVTLHIYINNVHNLCKRPRHGSRHLRERPQSTFFWLAKDQPSRSRERIRTEGLQTYSGIGRLMFYDNRPYRRSRKASPIIEGQNTRRPCQKNWRARPDYVCVFPGS